MLKFLDLRQNYDMDPTASFVLALVAIAIAGASAVLAGISINQTRKYRPKSDLMIRHDNTVLWRQDLPIPYVEVSVLNHGDGPAREVRVSLDNAKRNSSDTWVEISEIGSPGYAVVDVPLWRITASSESDWHPDEVPAVIVFPTMTVSWRKASGRGRIEISKVIDGDGWKPLT